MRPDDIETEAVATGKHSIAEQLSILKDQYSPQPRRTLESSGPPIIKPHPSAQNPILKPSDVSRNVSNVADPFLFIGEDNLHLFFEEFGGTDGFGIGHAYVRGPNNIHPGERIIQGPNGGSDNIAYPIVWRWDGEAMMTPNLGSKLDFDLYVNTGDITAASDWSLDTTLLSKSDAGVDISDPTPFFWNDRWWVIVYDPSTDQKHLFYADESKNIRGRSWTEHPNSPIITTDPVRNGGRPIVRDNCVDVFYQPQNQSEIQVWRFDGLTTTTINHYNAHPDAIYKRTDYGWNSNKAHHVDTLLPYAGGPSLVAVDGRSNTNYSIGMYTTSDQWRSQNRAFAGSNQSIGANSGWVRVNIDSVQATTDQRLDTGNYAIDTKTGGWYLVIARLAWDVQNSAATSGEVAARLFNVRNSNQLDLDNTQFTSDDEGLLIHNHLTTLARVPIASQLALEAQNNSGNSIDLKKNATKLMATRVF
jgi:hypothetical protein